MKKFFIVFPVILLLFALYSCSDDTTSSTSKKNIVISYEKQQKNDTLILTFKYQDTAYTFIDTASLSQFDTIPKVIYEVSPSNGYVDFTLFNNADTVFFKRFLPPYAGNTINLINIPNRYIFSLVSFTGSGSIKVVK